MRHGKALRRFARFPVTPSAARQLIDEYLGALTEGRWEEAWRRLSSADQAAMPLQRYVERCSSGRRMGPVAPHIVEEVVVEGEHATATVIVLRSLPLDPVEELRRLGASGDAQGPGARELRRILERWDGRYERRPRTVLLQHEADGWRVVEGFIARR